jgi:hypothetical protein
MIIQTETYKFNIKNPNDLKQVDDTKNKEIFSKRNIDEVGK